MESLRSNKQTDVVQTGQQPTSADIFDIYGQNMGVNYAYGPQVPGSTVGMWFGNADQTVQTTQDVNIYLPAAGMINGSNGGYCLDKGIKGYYWTATPSSDSGIDVDFAVYMHFSASADDVKKLNNQGRAYGFSIRCVRSI